MQYILTGQIFEAIQKNYIDKKTGEITKKFVELTVEQLFIDQEGNRIKVKTEGLDYIITKENPYKVPADQQKK